MLRHPACCLLLLLASLAMPGIASAADDHSPAAVKAAAQRGLAFLEKEGAIWYEEKSCLSCHHIPFQVWAHREAQQRRGLPVEQKKLDEWVGWCVELAEPKGGNDVLALLLNSLPRDMVPPGEAQKKLGTLPAKIAGFQKPDGSWAASGQFHAEQWSTEEANEATTRLMLQSLSTPWADAEKTRANRERALAWLKAKDEAARTGVPKSTRSYATRLAYAVYEKDNDRQTALSEKLVSLQKPDGGWSWKMDAKGSDPITTGEVLYALNSAKAQSLDIVAPRAVAYLLQAQGEDGSWYQDHKRISSKIRKEEKAKVDGIYTYWATAWATLGLLSTLPEVKPEVTVSR